MPPFHLLRIFKTYTWTTKLVAEHRYYPNKIYFRCNWNSWNIHKEQSAVNCNNKSLLLTYDLGHHYIKFHQSSGSSDGRKPAIWRTRGLVKLLIATQVKWVEVIYSIDIWSVLLKVVTTSTLVMAVRRHVCTIVVMVEAHVSVDLGQLLLTDSFLPVKVVHVLLRLGTHTRAVATARLLTIST